MDHAPNRRKRISVGRWYSFVKMQGRVAVPPAPHRRGQRELDPRHPRRHGRQLRPDAAGARRRRPRAVPARARRSTRIPGRLITTASADVALKGLAYLLEAMAKLRTERDVTLTIIGKPKDGKSMDLLRSLGLLPARRLRVGRDRRAHRRALRRGRAGRRAQPVRGVQPPRHRGDGHRHRARRHRRRRAARGHRPRRRDRAGVPGRRRRVRWRRRSPAASTTPSCAPASARPAASGCWSGGAGGAAPQQTVEQYREVLAMPANVDKLRRNGRASDRDVLTIRSARLAALGVAPGPRARCRRRLRPPRLRARPPGRARRRARLRRATR